MQQVEIVTIGDADGVVLPKELLVRLGLSCGDFAGIDFENGTLRLFKMDDPYTRAMHAGRDCFDRYPATLVELAR